MKSETPKVTTNEAESSLLPCPFCGGEARMSYSRDGEVCNVRCLKWGSDCMGAGSNQVHEDKAITAWNRRAALAPELLEALRGVIDHMEWSTEQGKAAFRTANIAIAKATERATMSPQPVTDSLIAAAPKMLGALLDIRDRLKECEGIPVTPEDAFDSFYREIVDEAIDAALGTTGEPKP